MRGGSRRRSSACVYRRGFAAWVGMTARPPQPHGKNETCDTVLAEKPRPSCTIIRVMRSRRPRSRPPCSPGGSDDPRWGLRGSIWASRSREGRWSDWEGARQDWRDRRFLLRPLGSEWTTSPSEDTGPGSSGHAVAIPDLPRMYTLPHRHLPRLACRSTFQTIPPVPSVLPPLLLMQSSCLPGTPPRAPCVR